MALTAELIAEFQQAIATGQIDLAVMQRGRSALRPRQLHDLRLLPTKDDPRPTFFWSAEGPRNDPDVHKTHPYPRLMWSPSGEEVTARSLADHQDLKALGYLETRPGELVVDQTAVMQAMLEGLSETDRALVLEGSKTARNKARIAALLELDDDAFAAVVQAVESVTLPKGKKSA